MPEQASYAKLKKNYFTPLEAIMKYGINDIPPPKALLLYSFQWLVLLLPNLVIIGSVAGHIFSYDTAVQALYTQKLFILMGIASLVQLLAGHRLPLIIGPSSALLAGLLASQASGPEACYTAIGIGGLALVALSFSGLLQQLRHIFTPRIIAVVLILIAVTLSSVVVRLIFSGQQSALFNLLFACSLMLALLIGSTFLSGMWKSSAILWTALSGCAIFFLIHGVPIDAEIPVRQAVSLAFWQNGWVFDGGTIVAYLFCMAALLVNELGSIEAVGHMLAADDMPTRTKNGVCLTGAANMAAGFFGVIGPVDLSLSSGVISTTGCASRYPLMLASLMLLAIGCIPSFIELLTYIPGVVMGGLMLYLLGAQLATGLMAAINAKAIISFQDCLVIGLPIMVGLLISFMPAEAALQLPEKLRPLLANGFVVGILFALFLEHIVFTGKRAG